MVHSDISRLANFTILKGVEYGSIRSQPLILDILLPKSITSAQGPRPVFINVHGGGLIGGSRDFEPWWSVYLLDWATRHNAIIVAPDYPLAPESQTPEIVGALKTFMDWVQTDLQSTLDQLVPDSKLTADMSRLAMHGDSAGGWAALQIGLAYPDKIRAMVLRFPMLDLDDPHFEGSLPMEEFLGRSIPRDLYDEHVKDMEPGKIVINSDPERFALMGATLMTGNLTKALGRSNETFPLKTIESGSARLPKRIWLLHGTDDMLVPVGGSEKTTRLINERVKGSEAKFDQRPGNHGFDTDWDMSHEPVVQERLAWLEEEWLR